MGSSSRPPRLINVQTCELGRVSWSNTIARPYAILSHTWGPDEDEVSFTEWQDGTAKHKAGYRKIIGAYELAKQDGLSYLWADTCCIDKRDQNELSRAINSMFAWYAGAQVCYALLSDVSLNTHMNAVTQMRNSRYFTLGWTLQEMLAPRVVEFYAADWSSLGSRDHLLVVLAEITGIEEAVLEHRKSLAQCSVAQKLSWASNRSTTGVEDLAYCLLGIVDVTMPLLYGEGQRAFRRLQEQVLTSSGDLSLFAWRHVEPERSSILFATSPADFYGSRNVVVDSNPLVSEHWMTNRGLKGTLSAHDQCDGGQCIKVLVPLNCHFDGCPDEPIVLHLSTHGAPLQNHDNVLTVEPWVESSSHASLLTRCSTISGLDLATVRQVQATILLEGSLEGAAPGKTVTPQKDPTTGNSTGAGTGTASIVGGVDCGRREPGGLCLLSLDGNGLRGLSTLYLLRSIMQLLNDERKARALDRVKPCEVFDLIGGTSTGGIIAIMLGRLEMDVDECITEYKKLMCNVFDRNKKSMFPVFGNTMLKPFSSRILQRAIKGVIKNVNEARADIPTQKLIPIDQPFYLESRNEDSQKCRVKKIGSITRLRSYRPKGEIPAQATTWQAALGTTAATSFFESANIGDYRYGDGALGADNPAKQVENEATEIWCEQPGELQWLVKCFLSLGTGHGGINPIIDKGWEDLSAGLKKVAVDTEATAADVGARWKNVPHKPYFRFNVQHGLQDVGLAECKPEKTGFIEAATSHYLGSKETRLHLRYCVERLRTKECRQ
ncbi:hypothetical protein LTR56_003020 [Elasticomyces elasticus]|nr:hypothetical protein LTR56_003020 [Elasticomyces elasticus]KAK3662083.1 hypothetical protein LTR22_007055 [Elasticomyces elasticus]KAK4927554.1 hypothetical protein LTR49_005695 [Elasticomyces elasticus]KAK5753233.1 hypothetical protein LTS12_016700 [Elasticomyces elasticus]